MQTLLRCPTYFEGFVFCRCAFWHPNSNLPGSRSCRTALRQKYII